MMLVSCGDARCGRPKKVDERDFNPEQLSICRQEALSIGSRRCVTLAELESF